VLDDLGGFINSFNLLFVFSILLFPGGVLLFSKSFFRSDSAFILFNILSGNSDFFFSFSKSVGGIFLKLGSGNELGFVIVDFGFHVINKFFT
jgi:uncharacterized membrane protein YjjP (DUF1212 family)